MTRQMQEAYIVAATRTPVGKAPRGAFRHTRPDSLLAHVLQSVLLQVPQIDAARIEDVIVGCAMPEYEQGMNVARIGLLLAGLPNTVVRDDDQPLLLVGPERGVDRRRPHPHRRGRHHDRRRHREHEHDPDAGPAGDQRRRVRPRREPRHRLRHGPHRGEGRRALESVARRAGRIRARQSHQKALAAQAAGEFDAEISPYPVRDSLPDLARGKIVVKSRSFERDEGPRADTTAEGLAKLRPVFAAQGLGDRRQQLADVRRRRRVDPGERERAEGTRPRAARALGRLRRRRRRAGGHGRRADRGDSEGAAPDRASGRTRSTGSNSTKRSRRRAWR